jgi:hypothetical protein
VKLVSFQSPLSCLFAVAVWTKTLLKSRM